IRRVRLRLGGTPPTVSSAAAAGTADDLERVAREAVASAFANAGQDCCARSRVIAERALYPKLVEAMAAAARARAIGDPLDPATEMGPLVSAGQRERTERYVALGREEGAERGCGRERLDRPGHLPPPAG